MINVSSRARFDGVDSLGLYMKKYKIPAIVSGGGMNGLGTVKNLGRYGVPTFCVADTKDDEVGH